MGQFACGAPGLPQAPPNEPLLQFLAPNDVIYYHKFKIITKSVTSSAGGRFSGEGIAEIPFLNYSSIRVNFVGIAVTQSRVVVGGIVESIYNPNSKVIYVTDKPLQEGAGQNQNGQGTSAVEVINFPGTIAAVTVNDKGEVVVTDADGKQTTYPRKKDSKTSAHGETVITDAAGNSYTVGKDGKVSKVEGGRLSPGGNANASVDGTVKFPFFIVYGCDMDKTIFYCTSTSLDAKVKSDLEALIKEKMSKIWSYMPSDVVINSDCKAIYPDYGELNVRKGSISWSEKEKKIFFSNLADNYDYAWKLNGAEYTVTEPLAVKDLKTGSNSLELQVMEKAKGSLFSKVILQVESGAVDMASYRLRVDRNGKVYYYNENANIGKDNGELPIDNETVALTLEHKEGNDWKAVENTEWSLDKEKADTATKLSVIFNDNTTHGYVDALIPGSNKTLRVNFDVKGALKAEEANTILNVEVRGLSTKNENKRRELFAWSMGKIKEINPTLYNYMTGQIASTQAYI
ncbi:MAG: hypothetical protein K2U26_08560, partial [Cyclobacteriaceae bacterium]|nr:hypothetical protein [Cyclobacteriaceae bacterium]